MGDIIGKLFDKSWLASRTMWVSVGFDIIYGALTFGTFVLEQLTVDWAVGALSIVAITQSQMMKYMRMITKTGILPVNKNRKMLVIQDEKEAAALISGATAPAAPAPAPAEPMVNRVIVPAPVVKAAVPKTTLVANDYFGVFANHDEVTKPIVAAADILLAKVNALLAQFRVEAGKSTDINPKTGSLVSGTTLGGFRLSGETVGASRSAHKEGKAIDIFDPNGDIDEWVTEKILVKYDLYREDPAATRGWCHLSTRAPGSGNRTFGV